MANGKPGRPKGLPKTGGRKPGVRAKAFTERQTYLENILGLSASEWTKEQLEALQPKDVMRMAMIQGVKQDDMKMAFTAAAALAPYVHPKLQTTTIRGDDTAPLLVEQAVKLVDERKPVELFLNEWQPKLIEGEAAD